MKAKMLRTLTLSAGFVMGASWALSASAGTISFSDISDLPLTTNTWTMATADLLGNGHQDILSGDGTLLMGDGTGHFTAGPSQTPANWMVFADINGDGKPDLIETDTSTQVAVLLNTTQPADTAPSFAAPVYFNAGTGGLSMVVAADVNGDGIPDLVAIDNGYYMVDVLINTTVQGGNTVTFSNPQALQAGNQVNWIAVGDLNGDGLADIVATNNMDNTISVFMNGTTLGGTTPNFAAQQVFSVGNFPNGVAIADINGDGNPDVIVSSMDLDNNGINYFSVLLNNTGNGSMTANLAAEQVVETGSNPNVVIALDIDGDGKPDVVTVNNNDCTVSVLLNTTAANSSTVSFAAPQAFSTGVDPEDVAAADVNGDGKPDLVVLDSASSGGWPSISILIN